jgi:NET1-associated nuclear protein 1 (U3 small nucleolar RNA-associated protein 17)
VKSSQESLPTPKLSQETGWEATFKTPTKTKELVHTNGINGDGINGQRDSNSVEAIDFEDFVENERKQKDEQTRLKKEEKALKRAVTRKPEEVWKVSESIGGRMIDVDPVFTRDEKYAISSLSQECC